MIKENTTNQILFSEYYKQWINTNKKGAVRDVTMQKYEMAYE